MHVGIASDNDQLFDLAATRVPVLEVVPPLSEVQRVAGVCVGRFDTTFVPAVDTPLRVRSRAPESLHVLTVRFSLLAAIIVGQEGWPRSHLAASSMHCLS